MLLSTSSQFVLVGLRASETVRIAMLSCVSMCWTLSTSSPYWHTIFCDRIYEVGSNKAPTECRKGEKCPNTSSLVPNQGCSKHTAGSSSTAFSSFDVKT